MMFPEKVYKFLIFIISRMVVLYLLIYFVSLWFVDYKKLNVKYKIATINRLKPSYVPLVEFVEKNKPLEKKVMRQYVRYYKNIIDLIPTARSDAYGMLAFCYYYLGEHDKSIKMYQKALELDPQFFWFYYNLGAVYFNTGRYEEAAKFFNQAREMKIERTVEYMSASKKIYWPIISSMSDVNKKTIIENLQKGFVDSFLATAESYYRLKKYQELFQLSAVFNVQGYKDSTGLIAYYTAVALFELKSYQEAMIYFRTLAQSEFTSKEVYEYLIQSLQAMGQDGLAKNVSDSYEYKNSKQRVNHFSTNQIDLRIY